MSKEISENENMKAVELLKSALMQISHIIDILERSLSHRNAVQKNQPPMLETGNFRMTDQNCLHLGRTIVSFNSRPLTLRLIKYLMSKQDLKATRDELLIAVFDCDTSKHSERFVSARMQNLSKLVSRARHLLEDAFQHELPDCARWFVHDHRKDTWTLLRLA